MPGPWQTGGGWKRGKELWSCRDCFSLKNGQSVSGKVDTWKLRGGPEPRSSKETVGRQLCRFAEKAASENIGDCILVHLNYASIESEHGARVWVLDFHCWCKWQAKVCALKKLLPYIAKRVSTHTITHPNGQKFHNRFDLYFKEEINISMRWSVCMDASSTFLLWIRWIQWLKSC